MSTSKRTVAWRLDIGACDPRVQCGRRLYTLWATTDGYTITLDQNIGKREAHGLDVVSSFPRPIGGAGNFSVSFIGSHLMNSKTDTGLYAYDGVGYFGEQCGIPNPGAAIIVRDGTAVHVLP